MNPRTRHLGSGSATTLEIELLVHSDKLYALPRLARRRALSRMGESNSMHFASPPTAASRMVVRPSPDLLYASCPFDLSSGPGGSPRVCHIRPTVFFFKQKTAYEMPK